ncbi:MAG TPA: hypothetical protein VGB41_05685 [Acidimicrobiia bacterium]
MDDTPVDALISELESADPVDAPDLADAVSEALAKTLEATAGEPDAAPPA